MESAGCPTKDDDIGVSSFDTKTGQSEPSIENSHLDLCRR